MVEQRRHCCGGDGDCAQPVVARVEIRDNLGRILVHTHTLCQWHVRVLTLSARRHGVALHSHRASDHKAMGGQ